MNQIGKKLSDCTYHKRPAWLGTKILFCCMLKTVLFFLDGCGRLAPPREIAYREAAGDVDGLMALLNDPTEKTRMHAAKSLGDLGEFSRKATADLMERTRDENERVALWAHYALARISSGDPQYVEAVGDALGSNNYDVQCDAAEALRLMARKARTQVPKLVGALGFAYRGRWRTEYTELFYTSWFLRASPPPLIPEFGSMLVSMYPGGPLPSVQVTENGISMQPPGSPLTEAKTIDPLISSLARGALNGITGKDFGYDQRAWLEWWDREGKPIAVRTAVREDLGVQGLAEALKHVHPDVRFAAAKALGEMGQAAREAVPILHEASETDKDWRVRRAAFVAIKKIEQANQKKQ